MMQASVYGRLGADPKTRTTRNDNPMATVNIAIDVTPGNTEETETLWISVLAFGRQADELARHSKGDLVSLSGRVTKNRWTTPEGTEREQLNLIADTLISARTTRPKGGRKPAEQRSPDRQDRQAQAPDTDAPFDDEIPF